MPGRDGTGPLGQGPVGGRAGMGGGRGRGNMAAGSGEYCVCPKCGEKYRINRERRAAQYYVQSAV